MLRDKDLVFTLLEKRLALQRDQIKQRLALGFFATEAAQVVYLSD